MYQQKIQLLEMAVSRLERELKNSEKELCKYFIERFKGVNPEYHEEIVAEYYDLNCKTDKEKFMEKWNSGNVSMVANHVYYSESYCLLCGDNGRLALFKEENNNHLIFAGGKDFLICENCTKSLFATKRN